MIAIKSIQRDDMMNIEGSAYDMPFSVEAANLACISISAPYLLGNIDPIRPIVDPTPVRVAAFTNSLCLVGDKLVSAGFRACSAVRPVGIYGEGRVTNNARFGDLVGQCPLGQDRNTLSALADESAPAFQGASEFVIGLLLGSKERLLADDA